MRDSVLFYRSFWEAVRELEPEGQARLIKAIMEYGLDGVEPEIGGVEKALFLLIRPQIDANNRRYENGKNGGRPKQKQNEKQEVSELEPEENQIETEQNQKEKKKEQEKEKVNSSATEKESSCVESFSLNDGTEYMISENDVELFQQLYPEIHVKQELRNIKAWCLANPEKRKTRSGAKRFLNSWLSRAQNSAKGNRFRSESPNRFHNFHQRETDYDALLMQEEKRLFEECGGMDDGKRIFRST
ncbi:DUF6291 domain-containing protein [Hominifimenecus sp. rT4P-3]|uniref:DUF6291 domain-containing protein n=1 Tax=Hominifimenecus sp. rT4P-3 TaxID=3242979 RepID=UPI003DA2762A